MVNINTLKSIASQFMSSEKLNKLTEAAQKANGIIALAKNPQEALRNAGVTLQDIQKAKNLVNTHVGAIALSMAGLKKEQALEILDKLSAGENLTQSEKVVSSDSQLEAMRADLARLNGNNK